MKEVQKQIISNPYISRASSVQFIKTLLGYLFCYLEVIHVKKQQANQTKKGYNSSNLTNAPGTFKIARASEDYTGLVHNVKHKHFFADDTDKTSFLLVT